MNRFKSQILKSVSPAILFLLCAVTLVTATAPRFDGEAIFRGLLLGSGSVAKIFPEYYHPEDASQNTAAKEEDSHLQMVIDAFKAQDPSFFERFGKDMQSGDPVKISQSLDEVQERFKTLTGGGGGHQHGETGSHGRAGHGTGHAPLLLAISQMQDIDRDALVSRIAERLGPQGKANR